MNQHYKHSGRVPVAAWLLALGGGTAFAAVLGVVYAYVIAYVPFVGKITFVIAAGFGAAVGAVTATLFRKAKGRSTAVGTLLGFVTLLVGYYFAWALWAYAVLSRGSVEVGVADLLLNPVALVEVLGRINEVGAWTLRGGTVNGTFLTVLWVIEALLIFGAGVFSAFAVADDGAFCESCGTWCAHHEGVVWLNPGATEPLAQRMAQRDWNVLGQYGAAVLGASPSIRLDLHHCAGCGQTNALSASTVTPSKEKNDVTEFVRKMLVTQDEKRWLFSLQAQHAGASPEHRAAAGLPPVPPQ